jgi:hypothetical protein
MIKVTSLLPRVGSRPTRKNLNNKKKGEVNMKMETRYLLVRYRAGDFDCFADLRVEVQD